MLEIGFARPSPLSAAAAIDETTIARLQITTDIASKLEPEAVSDG